MNGYLIILLSFLFNSIILAQTINCTLTTKKQWYSPKEKREFKASNCDECDLKVVNYLAKKYYLTIRDSYFYSKPVISPLSNDSDYEHDY